MPHSPRIHGGRVWLLDSGTGRLVHVDVRDGSIDTVARLPGYTRGLAFCGSLAFVGLSKIRESSTFGGVPIAADRDRLKCGVAIVDLAAGQTIGLLEFHTGIEEIFDVRLVPGVRSPYLSGPYPDVDQQSPIWLAPSAGADDRHRWQLCDELLRVQSISGAAHSWARVTGAFAAFRDSCSNS